ncbi:hypothetical protein V6N13_024845 [Hibiscus sabdariffa]
MLQENKNIGAILGKIIRPIRKVLRQQHVEMVFLVETKLEVVLEALIKSIWWTDSYRFEVSPFVGLSGGIVTIRELSKFYEIDSRIDQNFLLLRGSWHFDKWECGMMVVYTPCEVNARVGSKVSQLDRFLVSPAWIEKFSGLERFILQHGRVKLMESEWRQINEESVSPLSIIEKLRLLKAFLKERDGGVEA